MSCRGIPRELEVLIVSIGDIVYRHCNVVRSVDFVVEYLSRIESRPFLVIGPVPPQEEPVS